MPLHLVKLCVGCDNLEDLVDWIEFRIGEARAAGLEVEYGHVTRMVPKRAAELLDGGSLYWVIKGGVQCRQRIVDIRPFMDTDGIGRCRIILDRNVVETDRQPRRAFQGWRYFSAKDAPRDVANLNDGRTTLPAALRRELAELGLL